MTPPAWLMQEAVRLRSNYADAVTGMGVSLKELGRKEEAVACLQQVVRLRPHCALSLGNLAGKPASPPFCLLRDPLQDTSEALKPSGGIAPSCLQPAQRS